MDVLTILALIIALYGAGLSTYLAIKEAAKEKRRIAVFLEELIWQGDSQITIVNIGYRPITLVGIGMQIDGELVRGGALLESNPFPKVLEDGEHITLHLQKIVKEYLLVPHTPDFKKRVNISIYDAEGHTYTRYELKEIDTKWTAVAEEKPKLTSIG